MNEFLTEIWQNQKTLIFFGCGFLILLAVLAIFSAVDSVQVLGINRWIKPMKFASSIAIFLFTLAFYLEPLREKFGWSTRFISSVAIAMMVGEMVLIIMQAARGTTSHFNIATKFDMLVFNAMGLMIMLNTLLVIYLTFLYFRAEIDLPNAVLWGMRLGLVLFLLASFEGGYMASAMRHSVGVADGGAGLPVINWSTEGGDLRVAHFVGMHALQAIPLFALLLIWLKTRFSPIQPTTLTILFAILYFSAFTAVFVQALKGKPLLGKEIFIGKNSLPIERINQR